MTEFIVLSKVDMLTLCNDKPVTVRIDRSLMCFVLTNGLKSKRQKVRDKE